MKVKNGLVSIVIVAAELFSCDQGKSSAPDTGKPETINSAREYVYANSEGKRIILENGGPKGDTYTSKNGKKYFKVLFWTRIINEADTPLEFRIDFPYDWYELSSSPQIAFKILLPSDTMALDKMPSYNFGLTDLQSFLDSHIDKPSSLKRTINPNHASGFFVIILRPLAADGPSGILRTGMILKEQTLFYKISRYDSAPVHRLKDQTEIECGSINLKDLVLQR
jgi:hypothetical protein